jgi:hypothetical protein
MDEIWESQLFASLAELLDAVNARGLSADQFKIVPEVSASGRGLFHLIFRTGADADPLLAAVAVTENGEMVSLIEEERHEAVDEAEAILREHDHPNA